MSHAVASTSLALPKSSALAPVAPKLIRYSQIAPQPVEWLWKDRIAIGKLTLVVGEPGLGKGLLTVDLASRVSRGSPWPDASHERAPLGTAMVLHAEDDAADTVLARLSAAGADLDRIFTFQMEQPEGEAEISQPFSLREGLATLDAALAATPDCKLVVIDPITAYLGDACGNQNQEVRAIMGSLAEMARRRRVAIVAVAHLNKQVSQRAVLRVMGALSFVATARTVWGVMRDPENPDQRVMLPLKNNLSDDNRGMRFLLPKVDGALVPRVQWGTEPLAMSFQTFCDRKVSRTDREYFDSEKHVAVRLQEELADGPRERQWLDLVVPGSEEQLYRAAERLGVLKIKEGYCAGWMWMLPEHYPAWQVKHKQEQEQKKLQRIERKNEKRRKGRAQKNAPSDKPRAATKPEKNPVAKKKPQAGEMTPELRRLFEIRYPGIPAEEALHQLSQRFSQTVKDHEAEVEVKKRLRNEERSQDPDG